MSRSLSGVSVKKKGLTEKGDSRTVRWRRPVSCGSNLVAFLPSCVVFRLPPGAAAVQQELLRRKTETVVGLLVEEGGVDVEFGGIVGRAAQAAPVAWPR